MQITRRWVMAAMAAPAALGAQGNQGGPVIDAHNHLNYRTRADWAEADKKLIEAADKLGIEQLCCSILPPERPTTREGFENGNKWLLEAMGRFPGRVLGYCFVNPGYGQVALEEVRRYVEGHGFIGIKLYNDYKVTDPVVAPVLELAAKLRVPILQHAGHTSWLPSPQPNISDAGDLTRAAKRYPETMLICAHICGGGDWEWSIKALRNGGGNTFFDTSGSVADEGTVELAVRTLGAERVLFACDLSMTASVGRLRGAQIGEAERRQIFGENMKRILAARKGGRA